MPRNYIVRLTMDRQHEAILIRKRWPKLKDSLPMSVAEDQRNKDGKIEIIGGCVFRPFPTQRFIEVVFLAIATKFQTNGFGTLVLNRLKVHAQSLGM